MALDKRVVEGLEELVRLGEEVKGTRYNKRGSGFLSRIEAQGEYVYGVNPELAHQWGARCLNLLERVFGRESHYCQPFRDVLASFDDYRPVVRALGVLKAAHADVVSGYLFTVRRLTEAEIFDDFLSQAEHLSQAGYHAPAAVVAGAVLEDGLRKLCNRIGVPLSPKPKLDQMNAGLAGKGVYTKLDQKKITALAEIRNKAAHGRWEEFSPSDTEDMIKQTKALMEKFASIQSRDESA